MGFFSAIKDLLREWKEDDDKLKGKNQENLSNQTEAVVQQETVPIPTEDESQRDLYLDAWQDKEYRTLSTKYFQQIEEIEEKYSIYINGFGGPDAGDKLEKLCVDATISFHLLVPFWKKYNRDLPYSVPPFKRLAMLREKWGDYEGAALACVQQMRLGIYGDGTKGGMKGRLARLVRKGNLAENKEIMKEVSKYLEI